MAAREQEDGAMGAGGEEVGAFSLLAWATGVLLLCLAGVQVACHKFSQHKFARPAQIANWDGEGEGGEGSQGRQHAAAVNAVGHMLGNGYARL